MEVPRLSRRELAFVIGVPAAWGIMLLFHPIGEGFYPLIEDNLTAWLTMHIGMVIFVPLFAAAVYLLLRGLEGTAATAASAPIGLAVFAAFYAAFEITLGIGTGILTEQVNALPAAETAVGADLVQSYAESPIITVFTVIGTAGLTVAMIGGAMALRHAYDLGWGIPALMILSIPLISIHEPPFGPIGLAMFIVAVVLLERQRGTVPVAGAVPAGPRPA